MNIHYDTVSTTQHQAHHHLRNIHIIDEYLSIVIIFIGHNQQVFITYMCTVAVLKRLFVFHIHIKITQ